MIGPNFIEWRKTNLPCWRRVLRESIESRNTRREAYARDMLANVLEDPEYGKEVKEPIPVLVQKVGQASLF